MPNPDPILASSNYHRTAMFLEKTRYFARELEAQISQCRADPTLGAGFHDEIRAKADRAHARAVRAKIAARYTRDRAGGDPALAHFVADAERDAADAQETAARAEEMAQAFFHDCDCEERVVVEE